MGLGNGSILRVKRADLKPIDLKTKVHSGQISAMKLDSDNTMVTCSS